MSLRLSIHLCVFARNFLPVFVILLFVCLSTARANDQARVRISILMPGEVRVEAELASPMRSWSFRNAYAGVLGMAERVSDFSATGTSGEEARARKIATGEFRSELDASRITYTVKLSEPRPSDVPYVSWLSADRGFLMFLDLLPQDLKNVSASFTLPSGWTLESSITSGNAGRYEVLEPEKSVFIVGQSLRKAGGNVDGMNLDVVLSGSWPFKEPDALKVASTVLKKYLALTGYKLPDKAAILIAPSPVSIDSTEWKAETRGSTVVLLADPKKFDFWRNRLTIIFSHEALHLWVPNSLKLEGDYDWFFEGFTLYIALLTVQELGRIQFKETLDTLARVYDSYISRPDEVSLLQAAETRWTTPLTNVYNKGMLVAFLYDLKIRKESGGKTTLADRYRELFSARAAANANGNEVIIDLLDSAPAMNGFAKLYVETYTKIELEKLLPAYGFTLDSSGKQSRLQVSRDLNEEQKQLLRSFGYRK